MTRKEIIEKVLARVPEEKKEAFIKEFVESKDKTEKAAVMEKYSIALTTEELKAFRSGKLSDEELDEVAGGCNCNCGSSCEDCPDYFNNY